MCKRARFSHVWSNIPAKTGDKLLVICLWYMHVYIQNSFRATSQQAVGNGCYLNPLW